MILFQSKPKNDAYVTVTSQQRLYVALDNMNN